MLSRHRWKNMRENARVRAYRLNVLIFFFSCSPLHRRHRHLLLLLEARTRPAWRRRLVFFHFIDPDRVVLVAIASSTADHNHQQHQLDTSFVSVNARCCKERVRPMKTSSNKKSKKKSNDWRRTIRRGLSDLNNLFCLSFGVFISISGRLMNWRGMPRSWPIKTYQTLDKAWVCVHKFLIIMVPVSNDFRNRRKITVYGWDPRQSINYLN